MKPASDDDTRATLPASPSAALPVLDGGGSVSLPGAVAVERTPRDPRQRYHVLGEHGRGGLGRVFRAHDRDLGRDVAIKELITRSNVAERRFLRESLITARLEHPGIVPVHEAGRWEDGTPFYAMKLVAGRPLRELIAERTTVEQRIGLLHHVIAVADAIAYAHGRNIIHRDLKPANVIVGDFGETVVIDWGLAKDLSSSEDDPASSGSLVLNRNDELTTTGSVLGTPAYMAPEQERGEPVDQRADIFAIGAMLWELCALQRVPPVDMRQRHRMLRRGGIDRDLITIIDKTLDPDPRRRYSDAGALAADLKAFKTGERIAARSYSLLALLSHWSRRHRTLAMVLLVAVVFTAVGATLYVKAIAAERDRADGALAAEALQKRKAIIAQASSLLERDPTRAAAALGGLGALQAQPDTAVLRARIAAAGVADAVLSLPARIAQIELTPSGEQLIVATKERALYIIDLDTRIMRKIGDGLTEPSVVAATNDDVYFVEKSSVLQLTKVAVKSGARTEVAILDGLPIDVQARDVDVVWLTENGTLFEQTPGHSERLLARNVSQFVLSKDEIAICEKSQNLIIGAFDRVNRSMGRCIETWSWSQASEYMAFQIDLNRVGIYRDHVIRYYDLEQNPNAPIALSETRLIAAISKAGEGAFLPPDEAAFHHVQFEQRPTSVDARETFAAWGFPDGSATILDTESGREVTIKTHAQHAYCIRLLPGHRLLTCGESEIRLWTLRAGDSSMIAELPFRAFNIVFDQHKNALFDSAGGKVYMLEYGVAAPKSLHQHGSVAYSVAWCGSRACSASWDGKVLCSRSDGSNVKTLVDLNAPIRWLSGNMNRCFAASSEGGVYDIDNSAQPVYRHRHEPYRVAVSDDGKFVASSDWGGDLIIWSIGEKRVVADYPGLHSGRIMDLAWLDDRLITAGIDGRVRMFDSSFHESDSWDLHSPIRYMSAAKGIVATASEDGYVSRIVLNSKSIQRVQLEVIATAFAFSADARLVAIATDDGDVLTTDALGHIRVSTFDRGIITGIAFEDPCTLLVNGARGRVFRTNLNSL